MTIKEFARLCACNTQTLRYYDKIDLLKPIKVDLWSGYRYYEAVQAVEFVKIKNLQAADFTIGEIKGLLTKSDSEVYEAFCVKIAEQEQKLGRIREIQRSYLTEKINMEKIIYSMTDYLLSQCKSPEVLTEFGLTAADAPVILDGLKRYMIGTADKKEDGASLTVNEEVVQRREAVLDRIRALSDENAGDTVLLHTGFGYHTEHTADAEPSFEDYEAVWESCGWAHVYDFIDDMPRLETGRTYCLWLRTKETAYFDDLSFPMFLMGAVLYKQKLENVAVNCSASNAEDGKNQFRLLRKKQIV